MSGVEDEQPAPLLRIVRGDPRPDEVAALVAVVSALAAGAAEATARRRTRRPSEWAAHHRSLRPAHRHGPGAWRASAR